MLERREQESYLAYTKRLTQAVSEGIINYIEYGAYLMGEECPYSSENIRKFYYIYKRIMEQIDEPETNKLEENIKFQIEQMKHDLELERKKLQTVNLEYQANLRKEARAELFNEQIKDAIERLEPIKAKIFEHKKPTESTALLNLADAHFGKEFKLYGLFEEVVNEYSPEIFKLRMWDLLAQVSSDKFNYDKLIVNDGGDCIEGILRLNGLRKLKTGVVDSAMQYAEFMANWLVALSDKLEIPIEYSLQGGNHDLLRLLSSNKDFEDESIAKFIHKFIELRLKDNKNIKVNPYAEVSYYNFYGTNVLCYHGESKSLKGDIEFFENFYKIEIDILIGAHLHRNSQESIGIGYAGDREIIRVPSIQGTDTFSKTIRKLSRPGCKFTIFNANGKDLEKTYFLN